VVTQGPANPVDCVSRVVFHVIHAAASGAGSGAANGSFK
jgi:hypothetical protein